MDLHKTIRELYEEKKRLDQAISSLESFLAAKTDEVVTAGDSRKRRGRRSMGPEERRQVSERMKKYWAERRQLSESR